MNLLKAGNLTAAREVLAQALQLDAALPLTRQLLDWTRRGFSVNAARISEAQRKAGYFTVRADTVNAARAIDPAAGTAPLTIGAPHG